MKKAFRQLERFLLWYVVFKLSLIFLLFVKELYESLPGVQVRCDVFFVLEPKTLPLKLIRNMFDNIKF